MAAVTVWSIRDLTVVVVVVVFAETHPASYCSPLSIRAPLVGVDYPLPDFLLNFLVRGEWPEHIFQWAPKKYTNKFI